LSSNITSNSSSEADYPGLQQLLISEGFSEFL